MLAIKLLDSLIPKQRFHLVIKFFENTQKGANPQYTGCVQQKYPKGKKESKYQKIKEMQNVHGRE